MRYRQSLLFLAIGFLSIPVVIPTAGQQSKYPYQDKSKSVEVRINDLIKRMTLKEKIDQLRHIHKGRYNLNGSPDMQKLEKYTNGNSFGCIEGFRLTSHQYVNTMYPIQKYMRENTRLGIPVIPVLEGLHGIVQEGGTIFPQSIALASTFRPELSLQMAQYIGQEAASIGAKQVLAPDLDLAREPRWGRVEETYGEDPYLVGEMGSAYIKGLNMENIISTPKHFIAHGTPSGGINLAPVSGGLKDLYNLYLRPFEKVIQETAPLSIMNCYSSYDGEPVAGSSFFLTHLLRQQLGFKGYVYADWGSIDMLYYFHHTAADAADAGRQAVTAGLDVEASSSTYTHLESLVKEHKLDVKYIDQAVKNVLYVKFKSGLFDQPLPDTSAYVIQKDFHTPAAIRLARTIADESIVMLKNQADILPLNAKKIRTLAVIGPNADETQFGDYTWSSPNMAGVTPLEGLKRLLKDSVVIHYAKGCNITGMDTTGFVEARSAVDNSDAVVLFVGSRSAVLAKESFPPVSGEGYDLDDLHLPGAQEALVRSMQKEGKPIILVLVTGRPFVLSWEKENIPAIVVQWYGGEEQGNAIAAMLFGKVNPSGKLPISFPKSTGNIPDYYNYLPSERGFYRASGTEEKPGRDYVFAKPGALYSFGYGLSYTKFQLSDIQLSHLKALPSDTITASIRIKNTGERDGAEVIQLYVRDLVSSIETPVKALKGFKKVFLKQGEEKTVHINLNIRDLYIYNRDLKKVIEPGDFEVTIGTASDNIIFKKNITVFNTRKEKELAQTQQDANSGSRQAAVQMQAGDEQTIEISGIVRDVQASVISGVKISSKKGTHMVHTDMTGKYSISAAADDTLIFSKKGYQTLSLPIESNKNIDVTMKQEGY